MEPQKKIAVFLGEFDLQVAEVEKIFDRLIKILGRFDAKDVSIFFGMPTVMVLMMRDYHR
jgi:hypothetical protein